MTISAGLIEQISSQSVPTVETFTLQNSVCVSVYLGRIGVNRKAKKDQIDLKADKDYMDLQSKILKSTTLDAIATLDSKIRSYLEARCLPLTRIFKRGIYLLPPDLVTEFYEKVGEEKNPQNGTFRALRAALIGQFAEEYDGIKEAMRDKLGIHFSEANYLGSEEAIRACFRFDVAYVSFDVPVTLKGISEQMYRREQEKIREQTMGIARDIENTLAYTAQDLLTWLKDRLEDNEDGSKKRLVESKLELMNDFFDTLGKRNVTGNVALAEVASQGRVLMQLAAGTTDSRAALRQSVAYKRIIGEKIEEVKAVLTPFIIEQASRKFSFADDDE